MNDPMAMMKAQQAQPPAPQATPQGGPEQAMSELQRVGSDSDANASPQKNATDIDTVSNNTWLLFQIIFKVLNGLAQELAKGQGGQTPQGPVPPQMGGV